MIGHFSCSKYLLRAITLAIISSLFSGFCKTLLYFFGVINNLKSFQNNHKLFHPNLAILYQVENNQFHIIVSRQPEPNTTSIYADWRSVHADWGSKESKKNSRKRFHILYKWPGQAFLSRTILNENIYNKIVKCWVQSEINISIHLSMMTHYQVRDVCFCLKHCEI